MATNRTNRGGSTRKAPSGKKRAGVHGASDLEKGFYIGVVSFAVALTALLAHAAVFTPTENVSRWPAAVFRHRVAAPQSPVYGRAMLLNAKYDSRPYWHGSKLVVGAPTNRAMADLAIEHLIPCESGGKAVDRVDSNGKMSYGILQFQDWREWERVSGISGDPDNPNDAIRMAEWGIQHGMIDHWTCARILGEY